MKKRLFNILIVLLVVVAGLFALSKLFISKASLGSDTTITSNVDFVQSSITTDGMVTAQNQAKLSFQTSGKLTYLPFKEGDKVRAGQTIAKLDTYALQRQLTTALNNYKSARDTFDQTQQNNQDNILKSQVTPTYANANINVNSAVNDAIQRILDQSQMTLDNSVINVELADYALQLSTLTSPISGVVTHEDVNVAGVNVTPATSFTVADPTSIVFRANVPASMIYYVDLGSQVKLAIDGIPEQINGVVSRIYPTKINLTNGQSVYRVDITADGLKDSARLDQSGTAIISTNAKNVALVPAWTVLGGKHIWVEVNGKPQLKEVTVGKTHDNEIEILSGLSAGDKIIINPKFIPSLKYTLL